MDLEYRLSIRSMIKPTFNIGKSSYPVNIDLIFKLLAINVLFNTYLFRNDIKLPFMDFMNEIGKFNQLPWVITIVTLIGIVIILFSMAPRLGSVLIAMGMFVTIIGCKPCYSDSRMYVFSLFVLLALYDKRFGVKFLRLQVIILYFGSGINKLFDIDWQTGQYIGNWLIHKIENPVYIGVSSMFPSMVLAKFLSWSVIITELSIALCFMKKNTFKFGILLGILLHSGSMIVVNGVFGSFIAATFISYLAFIDWPDKMTISLPISSKSNLLIKFSFLIDPYNRNLMKINPDTSRAELSINNRKYSGFRVIQYFLIYSPISYFFVIGLILVPGFGYNWLKGILLIVSAFFMLPIAARVIDYLAFGSEAKSNLIN